MKKEVLKNFEHIDLTIVGFFIFLSVFVGMLLWINRRGSESVYKEVGQLPLEKE